jgi:hypothetical protein
MPPTCRGTWPNSETRIVDLQGLLGHDHEYTRKYVWAAIVPRRLFGSFEPSFYADSGISSTSGIATSSFSNLERGV